MSTSNEVSVPVALTPDDQSIMARTIESWRSRYSYMRGDECDATVMRKRTLRPLSALPAREGFKFRGIPKNGGRYLNCRLKSLPGAGVFIVAAGEYVYEDVSPKLAGWRPHV